ncbi:hypothetical protein R3Q50_005524, partial [Klebsiella oxytoca]|nr:hypothetical protein [Klebsiella oxytoca]
MSIIHVNQIGSKINNLFSDRIDKGDLNPQDKDVQTKILSRCLAAYAIY